MKKISIFGIIVVVLSSVFAKLYVEHNESKIKTLGFLASEVPLPSRFVSNMTPIECCEDIYLNFDVEYKLDSDDENILGDWLASDGKTSLRISIMPISQAEANATFSTITEIQRGLFIEKMKNIYTVAAKKQDIELDFLDDGYFLVNGNTVIWLKSIIKFNDLMHQRAFYYYLAKNKKIYTLSYFVDNYTEERPNDVILSSLNTLIVKRICH